MADRKGRREKPGKHPCLHLHSGALVFHPPHLFTATPHPELQVVCQVGCLRGQWGKQVWVGDWVEDVSLNIHPKSKEAEDIQFL